jgi:hypothetical protein
MENFKIFQTEEAKKDLISYEIAEIPGSAAKVTLGGEGNIQETFIPTGTPTNRYG